MSLSNGWKARLNDRKYCIVCSTVTRCITRVGLGPLSLLYQLQYFYAFYLM